MNILFIHQNFPGQFLHIAQLLHRDPAHCVRVITDAANDLPALAPDIRYSFDPRRVSASHPLGRSFTQRLARGEAAALAMRALKRQGFTPDIVVGHMGWGETLFVKDVWPSTRLVVYAEYFYRAQGADAGFDPEFAPKDDFAARIDLRARNAGFLLGLESADFGVTPTHWQGSLFPPEFGKKIVILHEGIDTALARPDAEAKFALPGGARVCQRRRKNVPDGGVKVLYGDSIRIASFRSPESHPPRSIHHLTPPRRVLHGAISGNAYAVPVMPLNDFCSE